MTSLAVAIPVKDEADRISACLQALAPQAAGHDLRVVLLLNNCTDSTASVVRSHCPSLPMPVDLVEVTLPPELASAGHARRLAMQRAAATLPPDGVLLTTDADSRVAHNWIAANLAALAAGAEVVAGRAIIDPVEAAAIPQHLHDDDVQECAYADLLDEIDALLDPDPVDPWPRHSEHSGASIAVTLAAYRRAGGIPAVKIGEDRAFVAALRAVDARIRHAPGVSVVVSGRTVGRATGGMADTIRRRIARQDAFVDDRLEPARDRARRATLRASFRGARRFAGCPATLPPALRLPRATVQAALALPFMGAGWAMLEAGSSTLTPRGVARADLARETATAAAIVDRLRRAVSLAA